MPELKRSPEGNIYDPGPYLARVVNHLDPKYMGMLNVELLREVGNVPKSTGQLYPVRYMSPFYGVQGMNLMEKTMTMLRHKSLTECGWSHQIREHWSWLSLSKGTQKVVSGSAAYLTNT